ncbi:aminopeptidase P family protein [Phaeovulum sp.]|uniref:aminopeptidase P family protein n=1 Tax=Phaeovulum sp. TaxID=2934796 RepID=UPI0039E49C64
MHQDFANRTRPQDGPPRLAQLRKLLQADGLCGYLVPRADAHQGEYVAPHDDRLAWLTGFTGSAGFAVVLADQAGVFIDGRYRLQVRAQVNLEVFTPVHWPETRLGPWLRAAQSGGGRVGFDPWLHTHKEITDLTSALAGSGITLCPVANLIDAIWCEQPAPPANPARIQPLEFAGEDSASKRGRLAQALRNSGVRSAVLTLPDSLCWLLNIRGSDIARNPVVQGFALLHDTGRLTLFANPAKFDADLRAHLGPDVTLRPDADLIVALRDLSGPVQLDPATAPHQLGLELAQRGTEIAWAEDPCILPKALKNPAEITGMQAAHLRDGAAMVEFLSWLDETAPKGHLTEVDVVRALETFREASNQLRDISFETICGAGPNGAIVHYRVTEASNRPITPGDILLIDSGGQYADGTTDITRTVPIGPVLQSARAPYTRALQGMIALSRARWPKGLTGRDLDPIARQHLWLAGQDYDHGTGHGVGAYLSVHEGPARISRTSEVPLQPGMILSNEPGYYREGAFGIRIENLILVEAGRPLPDADPRPMLAFRTLTFVPIDTRLILPEMLSPGEVRWLNAYHAQVLRLIGPRVSPPALAWLTRACAAIHSQSAA